MINTKTLLIIGAGGSVPYGYPTGFQLKEKLRNADNFHPRVKEYLLAMRNIGGGDRIIGEFCRQFNLSQQNSIDAFLAKRGEDKIGELITYGELGKLALASQLIECEVLEKLLEPGDDHWLQYVWTLMNDVSKTEFQNNQLKIVSFNYDRAVEKYFQTTIQHSYRVTPEEATTLRQSIEIVHVYGDLQSLESRAYGEKSRPIDKLGYERLKDIADCIKVIPESRDDSEEFKKAIEIIGWAEKICFIGFSFDPINVRRLGFPNHDLSKKKVFFTRYGMTSPEILNVDTRLNIKRDLRGAGGKNDDECFTDLKTFAYLKHAGVFLIDGGP